ncbi:hypothetical protein NPIL_468841 [Nephila pilipes]|uniref:Uncharacterized protein n=1 Tax=Nephila pilipes TaxID=299642 RepID=A0A8X6QU15_NEPPI|nr:hypothetical protein NPIL_468841 [Nephila pilipes]
MFYFLNISCDHKNTGWYEDINFTSSHGFVFMNIETQRGGYWKEEACSDVILILEQFKTYLNGPHGVSGASLIKPTKPQIIFPSSCSGV